MKNGKFVHTAEKIFTQDEVEAFSYVIEKILKIKGLQYKITSATYDVPNPYPYVKKHWAVITVRLFDRPVIYRTSIGTAVKDLEVIDITLTNEIGHSTYEHLQSGSEPDDEQYTAWFGLQNARFLLKGGKGFTLPNLQPHFSYGKNPMDIAADFNGFLNDLESITLVKEAQEQITESDMIVMPTQMSRRAV